MERGEQERPPLEFTCPICEQPTALIDGNTAIYKFPDPKYNFVFVVCNYGCDNPPFFIDEADLVHLDYIEPVEIFTENPDWVVNKYEETNGKVVEIDVNSEEFTVQAIALMHNHRKFIYEYEVEPYEF